MNSLFPPELRTASVVRRWSIVRTFNDDPVSGHLFYVSFYALQIARLIEWQGPLADLTFVAMMHDIEETISGDIVSPVKHEIVDEGRYNNFIAGEMKARLPMIETQLGVIMESEFGDQIEKIVKVADKIDAVLFLIIEQRMGNTVLAPLYQDALSNLQRAWTALWGAGDVVRYTILWDNEIWPAIQSHWKFGGVGVQ